MLQTPSLERFSFYPFSSQEDGLSVPKADIGKREVAETFMVAAVIVVADEVVDLGLEITRLAEAAIKIVPTIERWPRHANLCQLVLDR